VVTLLFLLLSLTLGNPDYQVRRSSAAILDRDPYVSLAASVATWYHPSAEVRKYRARQDILDFMAIQVYTTGGDEVPWTPLLRLGLLSRDEIDQIWAGGGSMVAIASGGYYAGTRWAVQYRYRGRTLLRGFHIR
jgi:hypothetical protein